MSDKKKRFRIDFVWEIKSYDEATETYTVKLVPNPIRYELKEVKGKQCLYDKLDKFSIPMEALLDLAKQAKGQPIYFQPQEIENSGQYVKSRIPIIQARLQGDERLAPFEDKSETFLDTLAQDKLGFVIMCVDIVGSTKLSINLEQEAYVRLISTALYEMSEIIPKFHGYVLKYTGDGLIGYFPEPSFIAKNDLAMDCALTIRRLVYRGLNPILKEKGYPGIDIRIGLDSGEACIITIGSPEAKRHKDIIGTVVSLAAKIQSLGEPGDVLLGDVTLRNLHTMWRQICKEVELGRDWEYKDEEGKPYKVHKVKFKE